MYDHAEFGKDTGYLGTDCAGVVGCEALRSLVMGLFDDIVTKEQKAFDQVLEQAKVKLIEAGTSLLELAKQELDGLTVTVTIKVSKS